MVLPAFLVTSLLSAQSPLRPNTPIARGEQSIYETWTVDDGLPVNSVNDILLGREGYLWLATFDGLVRFDGVRFTVYNVGNTEGLVSSRIASLVESGRGDLWMLTERGDVVCYDRRVFRSHDTTQGLPDNRATVLHVDYEGTLWVGTEHGVARESSSGFRPVAPGEMDVHVLSLWRSRDGAVWVGTRRHGIARVLGDSVEWIDPDGPSLTGPIQSISEDSAGAVWFSAGTSVYRWTAGTIQRIFTPHPLSALIGDVLPASPDTVWISTEVGVWVLEGDSAREAPGSGAANVLFQAPGGAVWYTVRNALYRAGTLMYEAKEGPQENGSGVLITAVTWGPEGSPWIGTNRAGLHHRKASPFTVYSEEEGVAFRNIYPILEDHTGAIWLGTWGSGVSRILADTVTSHDANGSGKLVLSLLEDREGRLWVGQEYGVMRCALSRVSCQWEGRPLLPSGTPVRALHQDHTGTIWVGSEAGLYRVRQNTWDLITPDAGGPRAPVRTFLEEPDGTLWLGTYGGGIVRFRDGRFSSLTTADGMPSNLVRSLHRDEDGVLWVGTEGRGLARVVIGNDSVPTQVTTYRKGDGLPSDIIHRILEDDQGRLWMSTNSGIFWVPRAELNVFAGGEVTQISAHVYTERDGLRHREGNGGMHPAGIKASDGRLWFPTQDGAVVVDPAHIPRHTVPPPLRIEQIVAGGEALIPDTQSVHLPRGVRALELEYTALSFLNPENLAFRYRLEGFDPDWVEVGRRRQAFYTNLPPGQYTFRVSLRDLGGEWSEREASVSLMIPPLFHETSLFQALLALAAGGLVLGGMQWRTAALRRRERALVAEVEAQTADIRRHEEQLERQNRELESRAEQLAALDHAKSRFFANVSHEFRTPLTLTIGPLEDVRGGLHGAVSHGASRQLSLALRNARRVLRLIDEILELSRMEDGKVRLQAIETDLGSWVGPLTASLAPAATRKGVLLQVSRADALLVWFDPDLLEKVVLNLVMNAIKYTPSGGTIVVEARAVRDSRIHPSPWAAVSIRDSGPGLPVEEQDRVFDRFYRATSDGTTPGTGIGLALAKDITELHGGHITVESTEGEGTEFIVWLPLGRDHLSDSQIRPVPSTPRPHPTPALTLLGEPGDTDKTGKEEEGDAEGAEDVTTILLVEDDPEIRAWVRSHFTAEYRIAEAEDGQEGLRQARDLTPDLIISDVMMPGLDGHELCRALREDPETDFIPILLLTARAEAGDRIAALDEGADDYVIKPFNMRELQARAANLIASRRHLRERFRGHAGASPPRNGSPTSGARALHPREVDLPSADEGYLARVRNAVEAGLGDENFTVAQLARDLGQDRSHLYRRLRELTGENPASLLRRMRLERAAQLLEREVGTVAEIAYSVGFRSVSHFCKCFREHHEVTPAAYARRPGA